VHLAGDHLARADIAVFGRRPFRVDAEGDDASVRRSNEALAAGRNEGGRVAHDVIGGKRDDDGTIIARQRVAGAGGDRRTGIAPRRLEQNVGFGADGRKLFGDQEPVLAVGHNDRPSKQRRVGDPAHGLLERRQRTEQRQELLRPVFARGRPQPRAGAAAHDQRNDRLSQFLPVLVIRRCEARTAVLIHRNLASLHVSLHFHIEPALSNGVQFSRGRSDIVSKVTARAGTPSPLAFLESYFPEMDVRCPRFITR